MGANGIGVAGDSTGDRVVDGPAVIDLFADQCRDQAVDTQLTTLQGDPILCRVDGLARPTPAPGRYREVNPTTRFMLLTEEAIGAQGGVYPVQQGGFALSVIEATDKKKYLYFDIKQVPHGTADAFSDWVMQLASQIKSDAGLDGIAVIVDDATVEAALRSNDYDFGDAGLLIRTT